MVEKASMKPICSYFLKGPKALIKKVPSKLCWERVLIILMGCLIYGCEIQVVDGTGNSTGLSFSLDPKSYDMPSNPNPTFKVQGFTKVHGNLQLFNDHECTIIASQPVEVTRSSETITSHSVKKLETKFWVQYTDPDNMWGNCIGTIVYKTNDDLTSVVSFQQEIGLNNLSFDIKSSFHAEGGSVQLYSDSKCSSAVSDAVKINSQTSDGLSVITTHELDYQPSYDFYVKRIYDNGKEKCIGPTIYAPKEKISFSKKHGFHLAPAFRAGGFYEGKGGTIQLFSDEKCIVAASDVVQIGNNDGKHIIAKPLNAYGFHYFYLKGIKHNGNSSCIGPLEHYFQPRMVPDQSKKYKAAFVAKELIEGGIIQLFTDSNCTNKASKPLQVEDNETYTQKITTTHMHTVTNSFYFKHESNESASNCIGPVKSSRSNFFISKDCNAQNKPDFEKPIYLAWCDGYKKYVHVLPGAGRSKTYPPYEIRDLVLNIKASTDKSCKISQENLYGLKRKNKSCEEVPTGGRRGCYDILMTSHKRTTMQKITKDVPYIGRNSFSTNNIHTSYAGNLQPRIVCKSENE